MNYLVACDRLFTEIPGGAYRVAWELAMLARNAGHNVAFLTGTTDRFAEPRRIEQGIEIVRYFIPRSSPLNPFRLRQLVAAAESAAQRHLRDRTWDLVHSHMLTTGLAAFRSVRAKRRICTIHSPAALEQRINWDDGSWQGRVKLLLGEGMLKRNEAELLNRADRLHALSAYTRSEIGQMFGAAIADRIDVIPWWPETTDAAADRQEARRALGWPTDRVIFFTLRRMVPRMGLTTFVEAIERIAHRSEFIAVLAGEGPEREALRARAEASAARDRFVFPGGLDEKQRALAYIAADAFILPTLKLECFGLVAIEALSVGCPVVASAVGAIPEILSPILPDWLFPPGDAGALASLLERILDARGSMPRREDLVAWVRERYSPERVTRSYLDFMFSVEQGAA